MKTIGIEQATLDTCLQDARHERVVITKDGVPVALIVGLEEMDEEQVDLGSSAEFWRLITERRQQNTVNREELDQAIDRQVGSE